MSKSELGAKTGTARGGTCPEISSIRVFALWLNLEKLNIVTKIVKILAFCSTLGYTIQESVAEFLFA